MLQITTIICPYISNFFTHILLNNEKVNKIIKNYDIIIPVPMEKMKKIKRGYNQTELITNLLKKYWKDIEINENLLMKNKDTQTQSTLRLKERHENVKNAFEIGNKNKLKNKNVILFDDIYTTGATANEISRILKNIGVNKILVFVLAKD